MTPSKAEEYRLAPPANCGNVRRLHENQHWEFYHIRYLSGARLLCSPAEGRLALHYGILPWNEYYPRLVIRRKGIDYPTVASLGVESEYHRVPYTSPDPLARFAVYRHVGKVFVSNDCGDRIALETVAETVGESMEKIIQLIRY